MIPLKDNIPSQTYPWVNYGLMGLNILVFALQMALGPKGLSWYEQFGMLPARFQGLSDMMVSPTWITSLFLHGSFFHLGSNLLYLWIFGDNVEDRMGHGRYILFYLICGVGSNGVQYLSDPLLAQPVIGASGAIAGVLGAYFVLYPHARILTLVPIFFFIQFFQLPALLLLFVWFIQQFLMGMLSLGSRGQGGVAWWAHLGGFVLGVALVYVFRRQNRSPTWSQYWPKNKRKTTWYP